MSGQRVHDLLGCGSQAGLLMASLEDESVQPVIAELRARQGRVLPYHVHHLQTCTPPVNEQKHRAQELCESGGGRPGLPVPNSPYGL